ncbi:MAG: thiamine ABC transporter substrate-binding protein [Dehalococcoidia bacterium]|nr:thiamine ABC transporter substrate-binding protein [Dehalococcoidia bacterium]
MIRSTAILAIVAALILLVMACGSDTAVPEATSAPPKATAVPAPKATAVPAPKATAVPAPKATAVPTPAPGSLVVLTNDSFDIGKEIIAQFEKDNNASVTIQKAGSSGQVLNRAILEKGNPSGDLLYGVDNTFLSRALREEIFIKYKSGQINNIPAQFILDDTFHVSPVDYGYVNINYDIAYLDDKGLAPPASLEVLTQPEWDGRLVVENPATSTPGLAFLIATVSYFGEDDDYDYLDFWAGLKENNVAVKEGWSEAYYTDFSKYGGDRPLVVSYATSPAAELFFSEGAYEVPPTGNVLVDKATFLQIEGIGILKGTKNESLAKKFIDFVLDLPFQEDIPGRMFVYPVNSKAQTPDYFQYAEVPTAPSDISAATIDAKRDEWIDAWTSVVIR